MKADDKTRLTKAGWKEGMLSDGLTRQVEEKVNDGGKEKGLWSRFARLAAERS